MNRAGVVLTALGLMAFSSPVWGTEGTTSCPQLAKALDDAAANASLSLAKGDYFPAADDPLPVSIRFLSGLPKRDGAPCWKQRDAGPVDAATAAAVIRASGLALGVARWRDGRMKWNELSSAYEIERMTGVRGPVSQYLADRSAYFEYDAGSISPVLWTVKQSLGVLQLSALCSAFGGRTDPLSFGYTIDPAVRTAGAAGGDLYDEFMEAERIRLLEECHLT